MIKFIENELAEKTTSKAKNQIVLFGLAGIANTIVGFIVFSGATLILQSPYWLSNFLAIIAGIICGYTLSRLFVFKKQNSEMQSNAWKYVVTILLQYIVGTALIGILVNAGYKEIPSYIIVLPVMFILSFVLQKFWVFKPTLET